MEAGMAGEATGSCQGQQGTGSGSNTLDPWGDYLQRQQFDQQTLNQVGGPRIPSTPTNGSRGGSSSPNPHQGGFWNQGLVTQPGVGFQQLPGVGLQQMPPGLGNSIDNIVAARIIFQQINPGELQVVFQEFFQRFNFQRQGGSEPQRLGQARFEPDLPTFVRSEGHDTLPPVGRESWRDEERDVFSRSEKWHSSPPQSNHESWRTREVKYWGWTSIFKSWCRGPWPMQCWVVSHAAMQTQFLMGQPVSTAYFPCAFLDSRPTLVQWGQPEKARLHGPHSGLYNTQARSYLSSVPIGCAVCSIQQIYPLKSPEFDPLVQYHGIRGNLCIVPFYPSAGFKGHGVRPQNMRYPAMRGLNMRSPKHFQYSGPTDWSTRMPDCRQNICQEGFPMLGTAVFPGQLCAASQWLPACHFENLRSRQWIPRNQIGYTWSSTSHQYKHNAPNIQISLCQGLESYLWSGHCC